MSTKQRILIEIDAGFDYDHLPELESWLEEYFGESEDVTISISDITENSKFDIPTAIIYRAMRGDFMDLLGYIPIAPETRIDWDCELHTLTNSEGVDLLKQAGCPIEYSHISNMDTSPGIYATGRCMLKITHVNQLSELGLPDSVTVEY